MNRLYFYKKNSLISSITFHCTGKALEDLRGSLFNEFRTVEGAKRQQQRTCGPAAALSFNFLVAVGIIFMNKMVRSLSFFLSGVAMFCVEISKYYGFYADLIDFIFFVVSFRCFKLSNSNSRYFSH